MTTIPYASIRMIVGNFHVGTADVELEADIRRRTAKWPPAAREEAVRFALDCHHHNQNLHRFVMQGC